MVNKFCFTFVSDAVSDGILGPGNPDANWWRPVVEKVFEQPCFIAGQSWIKRGPCHV